MKYVGSLSQSDPLHGYFRSDILPQLGIDSSYANFRVFRLKASNQVYLYEDRSSNVRIIGKFFGGIADRTDEVAHRRMEREYKNLHFARAFGFTSPPHYIPRPLGRNADCNFLLAEEFCEGTPLNDFIMGAIQNGAKGALFKKLSELALFLSNLHNRTPTRSKVDFRQDCSYFNRIIDQLKDRRYIDKTDAEAFSHLRDRWHEKTYMWEDNQVLIHGDVTPSNILFKDGLGVIAIDLERMKQGDRVFDIGRVAAEIKHFFLQHTGNKDLAEPFIGHFLWEYSSHFPDRHAAFSSISNRMPFHMGVTLLRIARNAWVSRDHRRHLINEARNTLM